MVLTTLYPTREERHHLCLCVCAITKHACRKRKNDDTIPKWVTSAVPPLDQMDSLSVSAKDAAMTVFSPSPAKEVFPVEVDRYATLPDQYVTQCDSTALRDLHHRLSLLTLR